jgi:hypothetical protein
MITNFHFKGIITLFFDDVLHFIYYVLLLLERKSYASKAHLQVSDLPFNSSLDSPTMTTSFTKSIYLGANSWMCFVSTSKTKVKR